MTPDRVIEVRRSWARELRENGHQHTAGGLPDATVLADPDWLRYVQAMAAQVPTDGELVTFPSEEEVRWGWPDGVAVVFAEPVQVGHVITSASAGDIHSRRTWNVPPHVEQQTLAGVIVKRRVTVPTVDIDERTTGHAVPALPLLWMGVDRGDVVSGWWVPGNTMAPAMPGMFSESARLEVAVVTALGHRLTRLDEPATASRGERRRIARDLPGGLRVLRLASGASVTRNETAGTVEWSHRWMVRGHWRLQPHGPGRTLRRLQWIDPYVKGPEDKPLDVRPTMWRAGAPS